MGGVEELRAFRVRVRPLDGDGPPWRFGSGYLVATGMVLTSRHVLQPPDSAKQPEQGDGCEVLAWPCDSDDWQPASLAWADSDHDVALVSVASSFTAVPVQFGRFEDTAVVPWTAVGFPIASIHTGGRRSEAAYGRLSPISQGLGGRLALTVESRKARPREDGDTGWAGLSGAAVFCGVHLVGVVTIDPFAWENSLEAARITTVTDIRGFRECLGGSPVLEQAGGLQDVSEALKRLPPGPAGQVALQAYLAALADELNRDPWTRAAGGHVSSITMLARRLAVHARADIGYGAPRQGDAEVDDADHLVERCERLVVLGGPGAGKSWLARRSMVRAAEAALTALAEGADPDSVEVPLFARCAVVLASDTDAWEAVVNAALREVGHRLGSDRVRQALGRRFLEQPGRYLVALDGLDEAEHLPSSEVLNRLPAVAGRQLRIILTTRPSSWRRQLPLDARNRLHRLAELQPLRYPEDVTVVVNRWLADQPKARDRLLTLFERRSDLSQMATVPLLCAMYCLLAGSGHPLPQTRRGLHERIVTRLLQGTWRLQQPASGQLTTARAALRELAWAGADADPVSGLGAWPEEVTSASLATLPEKVLAALSHVAPLAEYNPDEAVPPRRFVHRSIREHLVAEYLADLPLAEATRLIEPHLWYDPEWEQVLPTAIVGHPQRDALLHTLLLGDATTPATLAALDRRDGFGELRRLLEHLTSETSPTDWSAEHALLIDSMAEGLAAASMGWPGARPGPWDLVRLQDGAVPWRREAIPDWVGYLDLGPTTRANLIQSLVDVLVTGESRYLCEEDCLAIVLDELGCPIHQRQAVVEALTAQMLEVATERQAAALRVLTSGPPPDGLIEAVQDQLATVDDTYFPEQIAERLAGVLDLLGANPSVRRWAIALLIDRLTAVLGGPTEMEAREFDRNRLVNAIRRLGPEIEERCRTITLLLDLHKPLDSYQARELMKQIRSLVPNGPDTGSMLCYLVANGGPWEQRGQATELLGALAATATPEDQLAAIGAVRRRTEESTGYDLLQWVSHFKALHPVAELRSAVVEHLLGRLPETPLDSIAFITSPIQELGASREQRDRLVRHIVNNFMPVDQSMWLLELASRFNPRGAGRSAIVTALTRSVVSLSENDYFLSFIVKALEFTDDERRRLLDSLIEKVQTWPLWQMMTLAQDISVLDPTRTQRTTAVERLVERLEEVATIRNMEDLVSALVEADPAWTWQEAVSRKVLSLLPHTPPEDMYHFVWSENLPRLVPSAGDRRLLINSFIPHLKEEVVHERGWHSLEFLLILCEILEPSSAQEREITNRLMVILSSVPTYDAASVGKKLAGRGLHAGQRRTVVRRLLERLDDADASLDLLTVIADLHPNEDQRRAAVGAGLRHLECDESHEVADSTRGALLRLGFDGDAMADFVGQLHPYFGVESLLRDLAETLRHHTDPNHWHLMLAAWVDAHSVLYQGEARVADFTESDDQWD